MWLLKSQSELIFLGCLLQLFGGIFRVDAEENEDGSLYIHPFERAALDEFRQKLNSEPMFSSRSSGDFMKSDEYLVPWIRATNEFKINRRQDATSYHILMTNGPDVDKALANFQNSLNWRKDNRIDEIVNEDFSDLEKDFHYDLSRVDKDGRLVVAAKYSDWDLKKALEGTDPARFARYTLYVMEKAAQKARALHNSSQYSYLVDAKDFNVDQHRCPSCQALFSHVYGNLDTNYPQQVKSLIHVNAPEGYEKENEKFAAGLSSHWKNALLTYGNESEWLPKVGALLGDVAIPDEFRQESFRPTTSTTTQPPPPPTTARQPAPPEIATTAASKPPAGLFLWHNACGGCKVGG